MRPKRIAPGSGQESVWDYPRPPLLEKTSKHIQVIFQAIQIADTIQAYRVLETSHPPVYYIPPSDVKMEYLIPSVGGSLCEWKGRASYYSIEVSGYRIENAAWYYPKPTAPFIAIKDYIAFYPQMMDACYVDCERALPQPGKFYGGWITSDIVGPFKGEPGTLSW